MHAGVVVKLCMYLMFKWKYRQGITDVPKFKFEDSSAMQLLLAADFLNI